MVPQLVALVPTSVIFTYAAVSAAVSLLRDSEFLINTKQSEYKRGLDVNGRKGRKARVIGVEVAEGRRRWEAHGNTNHSVSLAMSRDSQLRRRVPFSLVPGPVSTATVSWGFQRITRITVCEL